MQEWWAWLGFSKSYYKISDAKSWCATPNFMRTGIFVCFVHKFIPNTDHSAWPIVRAPWTFVTHWINERNGTRSWRNKIEPDQRTQIIKSRSFGLYDTGSTEGFYSAVSVYCSDGWSSWCVQKIKGKEDRWAYHSHTKNACTGTSVGQKGMAPCKTWLCGTHCYLEKKQLVVKSMTGPICDEQEKDFLGVSGRSF
jgi:hypothetical protein